MAASKGQHSRTNISKPSKSSTRVSTKSRPDSDDGAQSDLPIEKDETERRLERTLFGDEAGFLDSLQNNTLSQKKALVRLPSAESDLEDQIEGLDEVADEDLFFLDSGSGALPSALVTRNATTDYHASLPEHKAAWYDSDDDRIQISLASNTRLRKLRESEADDLVTGRDYIRRLRLQYERLHPAPKWIEHAISRRRERNGGTRDVEDSDVSMASDISTDNDDLSVPAVQQLADLLRSGGALTKPENGSEGKKKRRKLRPEVIDIQRMSDIAPQGPSSIDTLQFHPRHTSPHCCFYVASKPSSQESEPDSRDTTKLFFASRRRYFHIWSLATGSVTKISRPMYGLSRYEQRTMEAFKLSPDGQLMALVGSARKGGGSVNVLSTQSMQWVCGCRIDSNGGIADFAWWRNAKGLTIAGKNGEVNEYDIASKRMLARWHDEGAVGTTIITLGGDLGRDGLLGGDRWVAVGSSSGVVNIYDRLEWPGARASTAEGEAELVPRRPKPTQVLDQLTTPISHLIFSSDGQMLVMGSRWKKNALRLVHLPSCTVYRNWPTNKTPLGRVSSVALSGDGRTLAAGNEQGKIRLWEVRE